MNYFDRYLEIELKQLLDPVVVRRPPARRRRSKVREAGYSQSPLALPTLAPETIPMVDAVVVTLPVSAARSL